MDKLALAIMLALILAFSLSPVLSAVTAGGFSSAGFFRENISNIVCDGTVYVTVNQAQYCGSSPYPSGLEKLTDTDGGTQQNRNTYQLEPIEFKTYFLYCEATANTCFTAMTYELKFEQVENGSMYKCVMNFTSDNEKRMPSKVSFRKNGDIVKSQPIKISDLVDISSDEAKAFSAISTLNIGRSSRHFYLLFVVLLFQLGLLISTLL